MGPGARCSGCHHRRAPARLCRQGPVSGRVLFVARGVSMERLSSFVLAHRRWIFVFWVVMFVAGIAAAGAVPDRLSYDFSLPGQQGYETEQKIIASYQGANAQAAYIPVVTVPAGPDGHGLGGGRAGGVRRPAQDPDAARRRLLPDQGQGVHHQRRPDDVRHRLRAAAQRVRRPQPEAGRGHVQRAAQAARLHRWPDRLRSSCRRAAATTVDRACSRRPCSGRSAPWPCSRSSSPRSSPSSRCSSPRSRSSRRSSSCCSSRSSPT